MENKNKFKKGDRVIIHQSPEYPLRSRLKTLHGQIGKIEVVLPGNESYIVYLEQERELINVREPNLIPYWKAELEPIHVIEVFDEDMNSLKSYKFYRTQPTQLDIFDFLVDTGGKYAEIRTVYQRRE